MEDLTTTAPAEILSQIAATDLHSSFGEPFLSAFRTTHTWGSERELTSAALICSLFLSVILEGFPSEKLNIFVRYTREYCSRFTFDCKMYDTIFEKMQPEALGRTALVDKEGKTVFRACCKQDIFEAFDFYTNR